MTLTEHLVLTAVITLGEGSCGAGRLARECARRKSHLRPVLQRRIGAVLPVRCELARRGLHGAQAVRDILTAAQRHAQAAVVRVLQMLRVLVVQPYCICMHTIRSDAGHTQAHHHRGAWNVRTAASALD